MAVFSQLQDLNVLRMTSSKFCELMLSLGEARMSERCSDITRGRVLQDNSMLHQTLQ